MDSLAQSHRCTIFFVLGPPGSGKGTLCKLVADQLDMPGHRYCHLSVGDYLRELCQPKGCYEAISFDVDKIRNHMRESKLLPADTLIPVLDHKVGLIPKGNSDTTAWLIDGFPRNIETALAFEEKVSPICINNTEF